ncbi:ATP-binding cassette domain-containing protein [Pseudomonas sp. R5(2019)]|uniref:ATP-binding cassette domain-containing protein n=1 Tax=Pseudomonas sp. R5(2019) TaxID=2697566 RepID=UPI0014123683|nr:ABC transporter ATP-binding protein [Pseudomonas sp. R5(2019)]NBA94215.1 AAA family ATPase [Pseudomonas sp. R5(2019)]
MAILTADNISFSHKNKCLFKSASLVIEKGSVTGLLGPNGAGKTTFFDILCGLRKPDTGTLSINANERLYLSQTLSTPATLKMSEVFRMLSCLCASTLPGKAYMLQRLERWSPNLAKRYGEIWDKRPAICSYGEIRCFFTLSLLGLPSDLIILDEPTAGVDPEFRYYLWQCIRQASDEGATVLVSSHHIDEIAQHCDDFYMITQRQFLGFSSGDEYKEFYKAATLDEAFIKAALAV